VNALRNIHRALVPQGILLDMHPIPPATRAEVGGESLGEFDDAEFQELVRTAEARILETRLFEHDSEIEFDWLERYDDPAQLLVDIKDGWDGCHVPADLEARILEAEPPVDIWERVVLRRFRATSRNRG
jgi:hypothetical protein